MARPLSCPSSMALARVRLAHVMALPASDENGPVCSWQPGSLMLPPCTIDSMIASGYADKSPRGKHVLKLSESNFPSKQGMDDQEGALIGCLIAKCRRQDKRPAHEDNIFVCNFKPCTFVVLTWVSMCWSYNAVAAPLPHRYGSLCYKYIALRDHSIIAALRACLR